MLGEETHARPAHRHSSPLTGCARVSGGESAQMAVAFVLTLMIVFLLFAFVVDVGVWALDHRNAQNQVDAAVLAAVQSFPSASTSTADAAAKDWLLHNGVPDTNADGIPDGLCTGSPEFSKSGLSPDPDLYDEVRVCVRRQSPAVFSYLAGVPFAWVSAAAKARVIEVPLEYAIMAMDPCGPSNGSFQISGGADVVVDGGGTYTKSDASCPPGLTVSGNGTLLDSDSGNDTVSGTCETNGNATILPDPDCTPQIPLDDPYRMTLDQNAIAPGHFPHTCSGGGNDNFNGNLTLAPPGVVVAGAVPYDPCKSVSLDGDTSGSGILLVTNGVYHFHRGLSMSGKIRVTDDPPGSGIPGGVLLFMTCDDQSFCNSVDPNAPDLPPDLNINGDVALAGHPSFRDTLIWVDRTGSPGPPECNVKIVGQALATISGRIYAMPCLVEMEASSGDFSLNMTIVANNVKLAGQATITFLWNVDLAPTILVPALIE